MPWATIWSQIMGQTHRGPSSKSRTLFSRSWPSGRANNYHKFVGVWRWPTMQNVIKVFGHLLCGVRSCNLVLSKVLFCQSTRAQPCWLQTYTQNNTCSSTVFCGDPRLYKSVFAKDTGKDASNFMTKLYSFDTKKLFTRNRSE